PVVSRCGLSGAVGARGGVGHGFRWCGFVGSSLVALGCSLLVAGATFPHWARPLFLLALAVVGLGMGPTSISFILAVQNAVSWGQRGVATGAAIFLRTIGGSTGVGLLGGMLGWTLARRLAAAHASGID